MKAVVIARQGGPEALEVREVATPEAGGNRSGSGSGPAG